MKASKQAMYQLCDILYPVFTPWFTSADACDPPSQVIGQLYGGISWLLTDNS